MTKINGFKNLTVIPDLLAPLEKIPFKIFKKYRPEFKSPKSLLNLCIDVIDSQKFEKWARFNNTGKWIDFYKIFAYHTAFCLVTDSYLRLCQPPNVRSTALFLFQKNRRISRQRSLSDFIKHIQIIRDETTEKVRFNELLNHWNRIPPKRPLCPRVLMANTKKVIINI